MKKILFLTWLFAMSYSVSQAQNIRIGFTAGASFANYNSKVNGNSDNGNSKIGFTAGVLADIPFSKNFSFQPAVNFVQKGTKDEQTYDYITEKVSLGTNHIEVPLNFLFNSGGDNGNFFIGAGPSLAFGVSGKWKYKDNSSSLTEDVNFGDTDEDDLKGVDFGANVLAGYNFPNGLLFAVNYNAGLSNLAPGHSSGSSLKSHYFGIKAGWILKGKEKK